MTKSLQANLIQGNLKKFLAKTRYIACTTWKMLSNCQQSSYHKQDIYFSLAISLYRDMHLQLCRKFDLAKNCLSKLSVKCSEKWGRVFFYINVFICVLLNSFFASEDLSSADDLCKQFGPKSGPMERRS